MGFWAKVIFDKTKGEILMSEKITWNGIFEDFKQRHPKYAKRVAGFAPRGTATILLMFKDKVRRTYNYDTKELVELKT